MTSALSVVTTDPVADPRWRQLATGPAASLFTSPPWIAAVCRTYGFTPQARIAVGHSGEPVGGLAWVGVDDARGQRLLSLPFCDRADPLVADRSVWNAVSAATTTGEPPFTLRCLDGSPAVDDPRLRVVGEAAWHGTPVDSGIDELHRRLSGTARRNIVAAERAGVTVEVRDDLEAVHVFHRLHVGLRKHKYRLLAQPVGFFERVWAEFTGGGCVTLLAHAGGEVVAAGLFLEWDGVLYYKFGASAGEPLHLRPNDAIYWTAIRRAVERGLRSVDWGLSDLDQPGLVAFKRKWASTERRVLTLRAGEPTPSEFGGTLGELTRILTDPSVPDEITAQAGAALYRYFC
ncbi:MAG: GNAT family N-acetyltransferase [Actinomycetota bacterium]|nr:GNAT family N-acetyltransferase [Actinomycetota bacterium]